MAETIRSRRVVVTASLNARDVAELDRIARLLDEAGWPGANRSMVIRMAIGYFSEGVRGKSHRQLVDFLLEHPAARMGPGAAAPAVPGVKR
jgi:hypothetical protein